MPCRTLIHAFAGILLASRVTAEGLDLQKYRLVDLTHAYNADTVFWPSTQERFKLESLHFGDTEAGYFYSANTFCLPEHGGTHLDAPIHFARGGVTANGEVLDAGDALKLIGVTRLDHVRRSACA